RALHCNPKRSPPRKAEDSHTFLLHHANTHSHILRLAHLEVLLLTACGFDDLIVVGCLYRRLFLVIKPGLFPSFVQKDTDRRKAQFLPAQAKLMADLDKDSRVKPR